MSDTQPVDTERSDADPGEDPDPGQDPSPEVADTQAPAHLEERGVDQQLEEQLDRGKES